jgi:hypothetical protein
MNPDENTQSTSPAQSYDTLDAAVASLVQSAPTRDPVTQQFAPRAKETAAPAPVVDMKTGKPVEAKIGHNGGPELEDEFFEYAPEKEGDAPRRVKADDVFAAYDELPKLRQQLAEAQRPATPPAQFVEQMQAVIDTRAQYADALAWAQQLGKPSPPDTRLRDPRNSAYDPDAYARSMEQYEAHMGDYQARAEHLREQMQVQQQQQQALVRMQQEAAEPVILKDWPELADQAKRAAVFNDVEKVLGVTANELRGITDPKVWSIVRDALAYRKGQQKQAEAVQVARAKPKFVKGSARQATNGSTEVARGSFDKTRSVEDGVAMLLAGST